MTFLVPKCHFYFVIWDIFNVLHYDFYSISRICIQMTAKIQTSTLFFEIVEKAGNSIFQDFCNFSKRENSNSSTLKILRQVFSLIDWMRKTVKKSGLNASLGISRKKVLKTRVCLLSWNSGLLGGELYEVSLIFPMHYIATYPSIRL